MTCDANPNSFFNAELERDTDTGVWQARVRRPINYASDDFARGPLLDILRAISDLGSTSAEVESQAVSWPATYYLSAKRSSLLRPFEWSSEARVLEVGSGCGSVTRFLGETFASVVGIEAELHRATAGAERSRDQDNVAVVSAPFEDLVPSMPFDIVFCIGVLEYSPLFSDSPDPLLESLRNFRSRLAGDGVLVLAIENKLGLKYFAGAAEDHTSIRYDGLEGYRRSGPRSPRTLGRSELKEKLGQAGFDGIEFFYPFPDYKLPRAVVAESAPRNGGGPLAEFLAQETAGDYLAQESKSRFNQRAAWHEVLNNRLLGDLANSFLVVASVGEEQRHVRAPWDVASYSLAPRRRAYWSEARVTGIGSGQAVISRRAMSPNPHESKLLAMSSGSVEPWFQSVTVGELAADTAMRRDATVALLAESLRPWIQFLRDHADGSGMLDGSFVDATPNNLVMNAEGPHYIDREWSWSEPLKLNTVASRGLGVFFSRVRDSAPLFHLLRQPVGLLIVCTARALGLKFDAQDLMDYMRFEARMRFEVEGRSARPARHALTLLMPGQMQILKGLGVRASLVGRRASRLVSKKILQRWLFPLRRPRVKRRLE